MRPARPAPVLVLRALAPLRLRSAPVGPPARLRHRWKEGTRWAPVQLRRKARSSRSDRSPRTGYRSVSAGHSLTRGPRLRFKGLEQLLRASCDRLRVETSSRKGNGTSRLSLGKSPLTTKTL